MRQIEVGLGPRLKLVSHISLDVNALINEENATSTHRVDQVFFLQTVSHLYGIKDEH